MVRNACTRSFEEPGNGYFFAWIKCDQIDMAKHAFDQTDQLTRVLFAVVHILDQSILKGQTTSGRIDIFATCGQ